MKKSINLTGKFRYHPYRFSRRDFMALAGLSATGMLLRSSAFSMPLRSKSSGGSRYLTQVAVTQADHYEQALMKQKVQHLFDSLGGISDVVGPGDRVAIKINLTGGSSWAGHPNLQGVDIRDSAWTHPEVLRAVGELLIDAGVSPSDIYIVEALWDDACYNNFGYLAVQQYLGAQRVNLNQAAPYPAFANISTGNNPFYYNSFIMNQILAEVDVCVSIPKMKHHYEAATTQSMKNHVGSVPLEYYQMPGLSGYRSAIHQEGGEVSYHLPRTICDLNMARPVNLAVIDGVLNAVGGEGPWNPTFTPAQYHYLLAGKDPVATDSIATLIMGADPEAEQLLKPNGQLCDNHLFLAQQKGMGTNLLEEIELVGDAAGTVVGVGEDGQVPAGSAVVRLYPNYPNPFRDFTTIRYYVGREERTTLWITDLSGKLVKVLEDGPLAPGEYLASWNPGGIAPGIYLCRLASGNEMVSRKITVAR
jgi:uncharacterized protein (DUF362 family)